MKHSSKIFEELCLNCPLNKQCYSQGNVSLNECRLVKKLGDSVNPTLLHNALQFKVVELYKWDRSNYLGFDIGWEKAWEEWRADGYDLDFRKVHDTLGGNNFITLYEEMNRIHSERIACEGHVLAGTF